MIQSDRLAEAQSVLNEILARDPRNAEAMHLLAIVHHQSGRHERALDLVTSALAAAECSPHFWNTKGSVERALGRHADALASLCRAISLAPNFALAHVHCGLALHALGRLEEAVANYRRAIELSPKEGRTHAHLGAALFDLGHFDAAAAAFDRALELGPAAQATRLLLARALMRGERHAEAIETLNKALVTNPGDREAARLLDECRKQVGNAATPPAGGGDTARALDLEANRAFAARVAKRAGPAPPRAFARAPKSKLRIGYLSGDFREHAVAILTAEIFELHDRDHFEVFGYSTGPDDGSALRARIARAFDTFVDLRGRPFGDAAERIVGDGIDVLVDLSTYTEYGVPEILALRAAPVQVNFLGYPGTLGADFADYIVADPFVIPPAHARDYAEAVAYMPACYMPSDRKRTISERPSRAACGLPENAFVFCCFNGLWKITEAMLDLWAGLLREVPGSVLWLRDISPAATRDFRAAARHYGVEDRILFAERVDGARHLARMGCADLFLDTIPYNAHSTANDVLWAGLPVLTCVGDTFVSRVCGSLLSAAGLPELITTSLDEYRALALRLARDPGVLGDLRTKLATTRLSCPLFDSARFTRNLETLYDRMWERHLDGARPAMIGIAANAT